jgi:methylmalonyl-CoA mutase C-terminal domain/subunit
MTPTRVLIGKVGLDGHDRGARVIARLLRDHGYEVVYTGLFQTPESIAAAAVQEDVDIVGVSILSGAHMTLAPRIVRELWASGSTASVVIGGIVPASDVKRLICAGVTAVLTPGASTETILSTMREATRRETGELVSVAGQTGA